MDLSFLPTNILSAFNKSDSRLISEIRLRINFPIKCKKGDKFYYLTENGLSILRDNSIICLREDVDNIITKLTYNSLYAYNNFLRQGFLTWEDGVRVGVAGTCVFENGENITIKNFSSLIIRIPRLINNSSDKLFKYFENDVLSSLIISPPAFGKTTLLKDFMLKVNSRNSHQILVVDERGEFSGVFGENIDKISYSNKYFALTLAVRSLSPSLVFVDELISIDDWKCVEYCVNSGVKIIATCHASCIEEVVAKPNFIKGVFERYFVLDNSGSPGVLKKVYDQSLMVL